MKNNVTIQKHHNALFIAAIEKQRTAMQIEYNNFKESGKTDEEIIQYFIAYRDEIMALDYYEKELWKGIK